MIVRVIVVVVMVVVDALGMREWTTIRMIRSGMVVRTDGALVIGSVTKEVVVDVLERKESGHY